MTNEPNTITSCGAMAPVEERLTGVCAVYLSGADTLRVKRVNVLSATSLEGPRGCVLHFDADDECIGITLPSVQASPMTARSAWEPLRAGFPDDIRERVDAWFRDGSWDIIL